MTQELIILSFTAVSIGFVHTLLGPDHYLPFIALAKARNWALGKTLSITALCGLGHVFSSVVLGMLGVALGWAVTSLEIFESTRGEIAAWLLIIFGLLYFIWGIKKAVQNKPHSHPVKSTTFWAIFIIFIFGPCEPLIPLLMYPAAQQSWLNLLIITALFSIATITTMMSMVVISLSSIKLFKFKFLHRYAHALAGFIIFACGMSMQFLGL